MAKELSPEEGAAVRSIITGLFALALTAAPNGDCRNPVSLIENAEKLADAYIDRGHVANLTALAK